VADTFKFRIDHHGSLVRPPELLAARAAGAPDLRAVEDTAIAEAVRRQRRLSLTVVTDGEFRRADFRSAVLDTVDGLDPGSLSGDGPGSLSGELKPHRSLVADDVAALTQLTQIAAKATLPSPAYLAAELFQPGGAWGSARELGLALAAIVRDEIEAIIARGVRYIQIDNPGYAGLLTGSGSTLDLDEAIEIDSLAVTPADKPFNVRIGMCPIVRADRADIGVAEKLFAGVPVDRWSLPFDKGTEAEVALLRAVPADKDVCLGIVDPTIAELEDIDTIMDRMDVAGAIRDLEDVAVSPSAGFSPVAGGNTIGVEDQWRKLTHVETIARMCWGNEL
jgi:5-methyltetrahydropteroyltriglutamate--homocysteine methyltransferase